jgi:hypothetical protein
MNFEDNEMMIDVDFEKVLVNTFIENVCIETVIGSPEFIYDNVAEYYNAQTNSCDFVYLD